MERFSINDIRSLMSAVSIAYIMSERKQEKKYWNALANRLNELAEEMEAVKKETDSQRSGANRVCASAMPQTSRRGGV